ncbi:MAG: 50S ribosomal protein L17 [Bacteriovoracaceae bacterium]
MRHGNYKNHLGLNTTHRKALLRNLAIELIDHGKVKTTASKCKALQPFFEKLVTLAKEDTLANRKLAISKLNSAIAAKGLFDNVAPKFKTRKGGYTRILKIADTRVGDGAPMGMITLVE